jgi:hypothetical protein
MHSPPIGGRAGWWAWHPRRNGTGRGARESLGTVTVVRPGGGRTGGGRVPYDFICSLLMYNAPRSRSRSRPPLNRSPVQPLAISIHLSATDVARSPSPPPLLALWVHPPSNRRPSGRPPPSFLSPPFSPRSASPWLAPVPLPGPLIRAARDRRHATAPPAFVRNA